MPCHCCGLDAEFFQTLLIIFLLALDRGLGDPVQIPHTGLGNSPSTLSAGTFLILVHLFQDAQLFQSLHNFAVHRAGGIDVVRGSRTSVLGASVDSSESAYTDRLSEVDMSRDGGSPDVEPVGRLGRELVGMRRLDSVDPTWYLQLALSLQELGICVDEFLGIDIFNGNATHDCGI